MDFEARAGIVACDAPWGRWWQGMDDVTVEVVLPSGSRARDVTCTIQPRRITCRLKTGQTYLEVGGFVLELG